MPDARLEKTRRAYDRTDLPTAYRFGDPTTQAWRRPSENAAEQLERQAHWNVIEGEEHA